MEVIDSADQPRVSRDEQAYREKQRVNVVSVIVNLVLAVGKLVFGVIGHSQALIADGIHSFSDLATDALVLVATKYGSEKPDEDHPYGHARIETAATVGLALLLFVVAVGIIMDAAERLFDPEALLIPGWLALSAAGLSILANEGLFQYTMRIANRWRSGLLKANAWHHRSDAISSIVVMVGIAGSMAGLTYLDAIGAIAVAIMIAKISWDLAWPGLRQLVDTGLEPEKVSAIRKSIREVEGVEALHQLRTRRMGEDVLMDVHIVVSPRLSVSEGHQISERVRAHVIKELDDVMDVTVHIDPEDDAQDTPSLGLPPRRKILEQLENNWRSIEASQSIERVNLHYLDGKIYVELLLPLSVAEEKSGLAAIADEFSQALVGRDEVADVKVCFH